MTMWSGAVDTVAYYLTPCANRGSPEPLYIYKDVHTSPVISIANPAEFVMVSGLVILYCTHTVGIM